MRVQAACRLVEDCSITEDDVCSATCWGGLKTCTRTCLNGAVGADDACSAEKEFKTEVCEEQDCREYTNLIDYLFEFFFSTNLKNNESRQAWRNSFVNRSELIFLSVVLRIWFNLTQLRKFLSIFCRKTFIFLKKISYAVT